MAFRRLLIKDFKTFVLKQSERVKQHGMAIAAVRLDRIRFFWKSESF
jgi:hypothetical protein